MVAPRKIPWKYLGHVPQDSRTHPCSEQWEFAGPEKRLAVNYLCQETLDPGPSIYRVKPSIHMSVWNEGPHPSGLLPSTFLGGLLLFAKCAGGRPSPLPLPGQDKAGRPTCPPLGGWGEVFSPDSPQPQCSGPALSQSHPLCLCLPSDSCLLWGTPRKLLVGREMEGHFCRSVSNSQE